MKSDWVTKRLEEVCEIQRGGSPRPIQAFLTKEENGINWIKISDATASEKYIYETEEKIKPEGAKRSRMVYDGDFILSNSMSFGRPYIMKTSGCIHDGWLVLRESGHKLNQDYLYHVLSSDLVFNQFDRLAAGSTVRNLNIGLVRGVEIPIPPIHEQERIVSILDEAFEGIATAKANAERNLQYAHALFESHLHSVFTQRGPGWEEKQLSEISLEFGRGKSKNRPRNDPKLYGGQHPFVQTGDISNADHWLTSYSQTYNDVGLAQSRLWPKGTICIAIVGATVGETAILDFDACFPDSVIGIVVNEQIADNEYVEYLLQAFKALLKEKGKGTARDNINLGTFEYQKFPFPSLKLQKHITATLNSLRQETQRLASIYERKLDALEALKKSLLHQAFTGML